MCKQVYGFLLLHFPAFRFHDLIPKCKIKTVIGIEFFVMKMMMRGVDPQFSEPAFTKESRINFNIQMIDHTAERHKNQIKEQHINIQRNKQQNGGKY